MTPTLGRNSRPLACAAGTAGYRQDRAPSQRPDPGRRGQKSTDDVTRRRAGPQADRAPFGIHTLCWRSPSMLKGRPSDMAASSRSPDDSPQCCDELFLMSCCQEGPGHRPVSPRRGARANVAFDRLQCHRNIICFPS